MTDDRNSVASQAACQQKATGTRDAVETAIDLAKSDYALTWEQQLAEAPDRISPWQKHADTQEKQ